jgi:hypothetical protein
MKEITKCIRDIGQANSWIFSTLDLTYEFWQMKLDKQSQPLTVFTIPGKGQFHWITSPMGLLGCPAPFECLVEGELQNIQNVIININDLLVHSDTHEKHLDVLEQALTRLEKNHLKINLDKCIFGNKEVSYLGFTLTPKGIKPRENKLKAIEQAKLPTDVKMIQSFVSLCNFFWMHTKDFYIIAGLLFKLTRSLLIQRGSTAWTSHGRFLNLMKQLISEPVMAFPITDWQYALITDATTSTADTPGGLRAILTQVDQHRKFYALSFASRQLKDHEKNYSPFLLDASLTIWGMDHFNEYLKGKKFILYMDHKPLEKLGHLHSQTMNRFQMALLEHDFIIQYKKGSDMPADYLSRLPAISDAPVITAFDPFQPGLDKLQQEEPYAKDIVTWRQTGKWLPHLTKRGITQILELCKKFFNDKEGLIWFKLTDYNYLRTALFLPQKYQKEALCKAHNSIFGGHNATLKTYIKITSYYWSGIYQDIKHHVQTCLTCQQWKRAPVKTTPLATLLIPE